MSNTFGPYQAPRYKIMGEDESGTALLLFHWSRSAESGVAQAKLDAVEFNKTFRQIWAEPIKSM